MDCRQHRLKGVLGLVKVGGTALEQWQYEATSGGRLWYAIDDEQRTLSDFLLLSVAALR
ncbi:hypothetical protein [Nonomuraea cypriaca]|uniref:hypothetical protein n=1 Tax=Nonomuraea cypriaca TaxID=1187855 RepID=UPI001A9CAC1C|nr:hypothetical protein [Nonomuraea cypriaca]